MAESEETPSEPLALVTLGRISHPVARHDFEQASCATSGRTLMFELIPQIMHHKCVRAVVANDVWRLLRKMTTEADGKRCIECGSVQQMECHEMWRYLPPAPGAPSSAHIMKLVGLQTLCHLCHLGKHIGYALRNPALYRQVKLHLTELYALPESVFAQLQEVAFAHVAELNKAGPRALDLTYLNMDRYIWIRHRFGRAFTADETASCSQLSRLSDLEC